MPLECFRKLCERIESEVGEENFLSEQYMKEKIQNAQSPKRHIYNAHCKTSGGYLSGEIKVAITLRLLAGASYLDVSQIFDVSYSTCYDILHKVTEEWFCNDCVAEYKLEKNLDDPKKLYKILEIFTSKGRSNGIFGGIIGALDGWLVKIKSPSWVNDGVKNSGTYFSRKGFFALNVQVIVDREKRILWRSISSKGSEHDSAAFKDSELYARLERLVGEMSDTTPLNYNGIQLYLIGDSAYALRPFLLCPYDKAEPGSAEDVFNFMLSSNRIFVECAFGEIDARFGIFWRPLQFDLCRHRFIIDACLRLHNFIVDYRIQATDNEDWEDDSVHYTSECLSFLINNPDVCVGVYGNGCMGSANRRGRPTLDEKKIA